MRQILWNCLKFFCHICENKYPYIIRNNGSLIINHIIKAKVSEAEKYFFRQFGNLIRRIVKKHDDIWQYDIIGKKC